MSFFNINGTQSNQNKAFNFQPFRMVEILPEDGEDAVAGGAGSLEPGELSTRNLASVRATPWTLDAILGTPRAIPPVPPFNEQNISTNPPEPPLEPPVDPEPPEVPSVGSDDPTDNRIKPRVFQADVISNENYQHQSVVTSYPVDKDSDISDHAFDKAFNISITAIQSQTVFSYVDTIGNIANSPLVTGARNLANYWGITDGPVETRVQAAYDLLTEWQRSGQPIAIHCKYAPQGFKDSEGEIVPFVIESLSIPRDKSVGQAIRVSVSLKRIKLVSLGVTSNTGYNSAAKIKGTGPKRDAPNSKKKAKPPKKRQIRECAFTDGIVEVSTKANPCKNPNVTN